MMSFTEFQASKVSTTVGESSLPTWINDDHQKILVYNNSCFIEEITTGHFIYHILHIGSQEYWTNDGEYDLKGLEHILYDWCRSEDHLR